MGNKFSSFFEAGDKLSVGLSKEYNKQLRQELININIKRERILAVALTSFLITIIGCILLINNNEILDRSLSRDSFYIHLVLITISIIFLISTGKISRNIKANITKLYYMHYFIITAVIFLCALIAVNNEMLNQRPFAYIIAIYSIASIIILNPMERRVLYLASYALYIFGSIYYWENSFRALESLIFTFPLLALAMIVSRINYSAFVNNFISNKVIEEKNKQLNEMYQTVEEALTVRTEELNQAIEIEKLRTTFFSNISHELRTPLNIIFSAQQMLQLVCKDEDIQNKRQDIQKYNNMAQQNCYRLIRLIENIIDITEIDAGQLKAKLGKHDIVRLVEEVTLATAEYVKDRNVKLSFTSQIKSRVITCDDQKITRVILNLLSNAVKFTPNGGAVSVSLNEVSDSIIINVRDNGIGIPKEMRESVFDPFVQVDKSISRLREGSGIGLAIVKAFIELHNGEITITSEEGHGSEFVIKLPADLSSCEEVISNKMADYKCYEKILMEFSDIYN